MRNKKALESTHPAIEISNDISGPIGKYAIMQVGNPGQYRVPFSSVDSLKLRFVR